MMPSQPPSPDLGRALGRVALIAALLLGFLVRASTFQSPLFDFHSWRQADTATIARNFARERFDPRYPQIDARGTSTAGYVETGLELEAWVVAALSRVTGFTPVLGRLVSTLSFPAAGLLLFLFIRDRHGREAALAGVWIYALGLPLTIYVDRAFLNESLLALLTIVTLRAAQQYLSGRRNALIVLLLATTLLGLVKPPYLIVWTTVAALFVEKRARRGLIGWELPVGIGLNLVAVMLWFTHAHTLFLHTGFSFGTTDKLFDATLLTADYAHVLGDRLTRDVLGPVVLALAGLGLWSAIRQGKRAEAAGLAGFALYLVIVTGGNLAHNYYQLQIVPVAVSLAAAGVGALLDRTASRGWSAQRRLYLTAVLLSLTTLTAFVRSVNFHSWYSVDQARVRVCTDLGPQLGNRDLVAFIGYKSPDILFCLDHRGWLLDEDTPPEDLRRVVAEGAAVIVVPRQFEDRLAALDPQSLRPLLSIPAFLVFRVVHP
ncbi:MAG: hypothetical protein ABI051_12870 [Vicinamibacterales bacterium]